MSGLTFLQSEDKTFTPTKDTEGPIVAMTHLAEQKKLSQQQSVQLKCFLFKYESDVLQLLSLLGFFCK